MIKIKDSGVKWIGEIPEDWMVDRIKNVLKERAEKNYPIKTENILSLTNDRGVIPYSEKGAVGNNAKEDLSGYKLAYPNDIVLNSMNVVIGSVGISKYFGAVSPVYYMLYLRNEKDSINYYNYLFQTQEMQKYLKGFGNGILEIRMRIPMINLNSVKIPIPLSDEQQKIANFLDKKCSQIDRLIKLQERQIEKLKEYKQSIITESVTKGIDKNAKLKDSGIEWIGKIPEDWEALKLKFIAKSFNKGSGITKEDVVINGEIPCVRYGEIYTKYENIFLECYTRTDLEKVKNPQYFSHGDILFTTTGELVEEIGKSVAYLGNRQCLAGGDIIVMKHNQVPEFLGYALDSIYMRKQKGLGKAKLKVVHTSQFLISNTYIALPNIETQKNIARYLNKKCSEIARLIEIKRNKINNLINYKKSLIYECVTGKRRV